MPDPRTAAGKRLVAALHLEGWRGPIDRHMPSVEAAILAIEAEAASLDSDELRKAVERLRDAYDENDGHQQAGTFWTELGRLFGRLALLDGDKAEAPRTITNIEDEFTGPES